MTDEKDETKRAPGRPRLDEGGEAKAVIFSIRLSADERAEIERAASKAGATSASRWARKAVLAAARKKNAR